MRNHPLVKALPLVVGLAIAALLSTALVICMWAYSTYSYIKYEDKYVTGVDYILYLDSTHHRTSFSLICGKYPTPLTVKADSKIKMRKLCEPGERISQVYVNTSKLEVILETTIHSVGE